MFIETETGKKAVKCQLSTKEGACGCVPSGKSRKEAYLVFLETDFWKQTSQECRKLSEFKCSKCKIKKHNLQAHHKRYNDCWFDVSQSDLACLCRKCHLEEHDRIDAIIEKKNAKKAKRREAKLQRQEARKLKKENKQQRLSIRQRNKQFRKATNWVGGKSKHLSGHQKHLVMGEYSEGCSLCIEVLKSFQSKLPQPGAVASLPSPEILGDDTIVITEAFLLSGSTKGQGWSKAQLNILGLKYPPPSGWKKMLEGTKITEARAKQFLAANKQIKRQQAPKASKACVSDYQI